MIFLAKSPLSHLHESTRAPQRKIPWRSARGLWPPVLAMPAPNPQNSRHQSPNNQWLTSYVAVLTPMAVRLYPK